MPLSRVVVTYDTINKAIRHDEAVSENAVKNAATSRQQERDIRLRLNSALVKLEKENDRVRAANGSPQVMIAPNHRDASLLQSFITEHAAKLGKLEPISVTGGFEAKFDEKDWARWAGSLFTWWKSFSPHDFPRAAESPDEMPDSVRISVLADWGTGLYGAPQSAKSIEHSSTGYQVLIHLGDVYYSGTHKEEQSQFLDLWPKKGGSRSRACNSNHEMYTGGHAYFDLALQDPRFDQRASYFALQNKHWVLVGLDSAYSEWDLYGDQIEWLNRIIQRAGNRKIIFFSHHQLFSLFQDLSKTWLRMRISSLLERQKIFAWYWGHEHRCVFFDKHPSWGVFGRCIGHGGFPYFRENLANAAVELSNDTTNTKWRRLPSTHLAPSGIMLDGPNPYLIGYENEYGVQGYLTLELNGNQLNEIVHTPDGTSVYQNKLT